MRDFIISLSTGYMLWGAFAAIGLFGFGAGWFFRGLQWPTDNDLKWSRIAREGRIGFRKEWNENTGLWNLSRYEKDM